MTDSKRTEGGGVAEEWTEAELSVLLFTGVDTDLYGESDGSVTHEASTALIPKRTPVDLLVLTCWNLYGLRLQILLP